MKINIYINIAVMGDVNRNLTHLLKSIKDSYLYNNCNKIIFVINGNVKMLNIPYASSMDKIEYRITNYDTSVCEFSGLYELWKDSYQDDFYLLYLHTKGVSKPGLRSIRQWTNLLIYFNITKWKDRVTELEKFDCVGVNLKGNMKNFKLFNNRWSEGKTPLHFSGNFWWSNSNYIRKLPNPFDELPDKDFFRWRHFCEMWLLQKEAKIKSAYQSGVRHYNGDLYPSIFYVHSNYFAFFQRIIRKFYLIYLKFIKNRMILVLFSKAKYFIITL